jgi:hypothetical protein
MRVVILQPGYLPWLGFFDQLRQSDVFVFYDDVQFDRRGWRHRNRIKSAAGVRWLTVPVLKKGRYTQTIRDTRIDTASPWQRKHLKSLEMSYRRAPYFDRYFPELADVIERRWTFLLDLDVAIVQLIAGWIGLQRETRLSSDLGIGGRATQRLCDICEVLGATEYLSGDAANAYLDGSIFAARGIQLRYHHYDHPTYRQLFEPFVSHLSVVDLLLNHGPDSLAILSGQRITQAYAVGSAPIDARAVFCRGSGAA